MRRFRRFLGLSGKEKWLLIESILLVAIAIITVAIMPFSFLQSWVMRKPHLKTKKNFSQEQISWAVSVVGRFLPGSTCLAEALATQVLMRQCGYDPVIRVGVRKREDSELTAHAWVESAGKVVTGSNERLERYDQISAF